MTLVDENFNQKIYKVKHIHSSGENDYETYIFVGSHYSNDIYKLIDKIENNDYKFLTDEENKILSHSIPNFRAKFGKIIIGKTYFIRDLIFENDSINLIKIKISHYLEQFRLKQENKNKNINKNNYIGLHHQHLWIKSNNITFNDLIKFINNLIYMNNEVLMDDLILKLQVILDLKSQNEIELLVKEIFYEKYKNKSIDKTINLFDKANNFYTIDDLVNNEEFIALLNHRNIILGKTYKKET
jgi:hypothetical protein